jgi:hypothetical protein
MSEFTLQGLDGGSPLGFLATLGVLRTSALAWPERAVQLVWSDRDGGWRPRLFLHPSIDEEAWLEGLDHRLRDTIGHDAFKLADDLNVRIATFRKVALEAAARSRPDERRHADFLAAFGSDAVETVANGKKTGDISDTALRTMSGAGHQHFLGFMRALVADTRVEHLRRALLMSWQYDDPMENHTMRWDPTDDVRYALRWRNSSGDPERKRSGAVWGANRFAIEGLALLPTAPVQRRLQTTGFTQRKGQGTTWTWPIWNVPIGQDGVRSLLALAQLQEPCPDRAWLAAMGIAEVYRCQRITQGKYRNFTPASPA